MNVLHVISDLDPAGGGPPRALFGLACAQAEAGLRVEVVSTHAKAADLSLAREMRDRGVSVQMVGPVVGPLGWHAKLRATMATAVDRADVLHIHALWEQVQFEAARAARRGGKPYVIRPCGMLDPWSLAQSALKKRLYTAWRLRRMLDHASVMHFATQTEAQASAPKVPAGVRSLVEPIGVGLDEFEPLPEPGAFRRTNPKVGDRTMVVFLGRIHPGKGVDRLVQAFASAPDSAVLVVVGPDSAGHQTAVRKQVRAHGLDERVLFTGMLAGADRVAPLADADLFVLHSDHENFGISVVEALAAGTPVLVSDHVALHEEVTAAGVGESVALPQPALADALGRWLSDPGLRRAAAERARPFVWEKFGWPRIAQRWAEHYKSIVEGHPASGKAS